MNKTQKDILAHYPEYEATIGIEVHVQLKTNSKIFCGCPNKFGQQANSNICEICSGHPGTLPVLNKKVVDYAIMAGLATNCTISEKSDFARKHYFYPDLPKNYQITQDKKPICENGHIIITLPDGVTKKINIERIHMEEDAGKNIHAHDGRSLVDLNRAGTPLLEIVTKPDMSSTQEARAYLMQLHSIVRYLGISDANMEQGSFRADINISVKRKDAEKLGTRVELKNINSFKFICQAIDYELERHLELVTNGEGDKIKQETRLWDSKKNQTYFMRSKEEAQDYKYFVDPDLPKILIDETWMSNIKKLIPELPAAKLERFQNEYKLTPYEAEILIGDQQLAHFFEQATQESKLPKLVSNWLLRDVLGYLKDQKLTLSELTITPQHIAELVMQLDKGVINSKAAQEVFAVMMSSGTMPIQIIKDKGLEQIGSTEELETIVKDIIAQNPDNVAAYKAGKERVFGFFVGQAMKATKGKGNPKILTDLFKKHLQ